MDSQFIIEYKGLTGNINGLLINLSFSCKTDKLIDFLIRVKIEINLSVIGNMFLRSLNCTNKILFIPCHFPIQAIIFVLAYVLLRLRVQNRRKK